MQTAPTTDRVPELKCKRYGGNRQALAYVNVWGKQITFGPWGDDPKRPCREAFDKHWRWLNTVWFPNGGVEPGPEPEAYTAEMMCCEWFEADALQRLSGEDGEQTAELRHCRAALRAFLDLYGPASPEEIDATWWNKIAERIGLQTRGQRVTRATLNKRLQHIKACYRWAASHKVVTAEAAARVSLFRRYTRRDKSVGRVRFNESRDVLPVPDEHLEAVLGHVSPVVGAYLRALRHTGARPGELLRLRVGDVQAIEHDLPGGKHTVLYRVELREHKNAHRGKDRTIVFGPQAKAAIDPMLTGKNTDDPVFDARESARWHREQRTRNRKTPLNQGNTPGPHKPDPVRSPGEFFEDRSVANAVKRACIKAGVPHWSPAQLRHSFATEVREMMGLEAAGDALGHAGLTLTAAVYAERTLRNSIAAALRCG